jgi:hypothetical protein
MPTTHTSTTLMRSLLLAILVVPLVAVMWLSGASTDPAKPSGRLAELYETEMLSAFNELGATVGPEACFMSGNISLGVTCRVHGISSRQVADHFRTRGWRTSPEFTDNRPVLRRESDRLSVEHLSSSGELSVSILRVKG